MAFIYDQNPLIKTVYPRVNYLALAKLLFEGIDLELNFSLLSLLLGPLSHEPHMLYLESL